MYERFTDRARKVMRFANQEAQRFNHEYIGTEHILLGLVKEGSGTAAMVLQSAGVDLRKVRLQVEMIVQAGPDMVTMGTLPQTPRAKKVIEYAIEEARRLHHNYIGTEHLLLGMLREEEGVAAQVLMNLGLKLEHVRGKVLGILGADPSVQQRTRMQQRIGLTGRVRRVIQLANHEALRLDHEYVAVEDILLGLLNEAELTPEMPGIAAEVLNHFHVDLAVLRAELEKLLRSQPIGALPGAKVLIEHAIEEGGRLGFSEIGTGLLLLAILRESVAAQLLTSLGLNLEEVRSEIVKSLGPQTASAPTGDKPGFEAYKDEWAQMLTLKKHVRQAITDLGARIAELTEQKEAAVAERDFEKAAHLRDEADDLKRRRQKLMDEADRDSR